MEQEKKKSCSEGVLLVLWYGSCICCIFWL